MSWAFDTTRQARNRADGGGVKTRRSIRSGTAPGTAAARLGPPVWTDLRREGSVRRCGHRYDIWQSRLGKHPSAGHRHRSRGHRLLQAGARLVGKTKTMELAYGLTGENIWQGTPLNPRAPRPVSRRFELRLGGGSRRVGWPISRSAPIPAARCAYRPAIVACSASGPPSARSAWPVHVRWHPISIPAAGSPAALPAGRVGEVLLPGGRQGVDGPLLRVEEAWVNAQPDVAEALRPALEKLEQLRGRAVGVRLAPEGIDSFFDHFRTVQAEEAWATLGGWVEAVKPRFGPGIGERFAAAKATDPAVAAPGRAFRRLFQARVRPLLAGGAVLIYPTSPCPGPAVVREHGGAGCHPSGDHRRDGDRRLLRVAGGDPAGGCRWRRPGRDSRWSPLPASIADCWRLPATPRPCLGSRSDRGTRRDGDTRGNRSGYPGNPGDLCPSRVDRRRHLRGGTAVGRGNDRSGSPR